MISTAAIPGHVPQSVVVDFDIFSPPDLKKGVHEAWLALHRSNRSSVLWTPRNGGHWIVNSGQLVPQFYADFKHFSSRNEFLPRSTANSIPASLDPPEHTKFRRIINTILTPKYVSSMDGEIEARTINLVEGLVPKRRCDFVSDFALKLGTVAAMLSFIFLYLARHPELRKLLAAEEEILSGAVEEFLRRFPIVSPVREVVDDYPCDGVTLHQGDLIVIPTMLHGLDSQIFPDAEAVDPRRKSQVTSTFGQGPHRCPGAMLARAEVRTVLREWLRRIPDFNVEREDDIEFRAGIVGSIARLPLHWT